jgi:pyruvate dehydrogenase (quinone)/pyruvate oxidase
MERCDTLFMVGSSFPYTSYLPDPSSTRCVQIDADPVRAGNRMPTEVPLVGDARETLLALRSLIERKDDRSYLSDCQDEMRKWRDDTKALESPTRSPIQPQYLAAVLNELADDDAILCADSGTVATWAARHFDIRGDRRFYLSGNLATMAPGFPYALAAQWAHRDRQCIAFVGDGAFSMLMAEFLTAKRFDLPVKVIVCNNAILGQILWEQMALGYPEFGVRWTARADFAPWAEACGAFGRRVEAPGDLRDAMKSAFAFDGPALVDVVVNSDEPPMPPKVTYEQAKHFAESFLGQPRRAAILSTIARDKFAEWKS